MTDWMSHRFMDIELWRWLTVLGVLLGSMVIGKILSFILNHHGKKCLRRGRLHLAGLLFQSIAKPCSLLVLAGGIYASGLLLELPYNIRPLYFKVCDTVIAIAIIWAAFKLVDIIEFGLSRLTAKTETTLDDQLVPLVRKTLRVFVVIVGGLFIAQTIYDWDIGALLAGLGIGGLAFALAAKDMLANFFGSATIFADRPFTMGDRIKIKSYDGVVEEVGFRSTRIRLLNGHLVSLPNGLLANEPVENISRRPFIRHDLNVTVTYDTSPKKMNRAVEILNEMLNARKANFPPDRPGRVYFMDFNAASLGIAVTYWFTPPEWFDYCQFNHEFNMELLQRFNEEGIEFAFPTQTLYLKNNPPTE